MSILFSLNLKFRKSAAQYVHVKVGTIPRHDLPHILWILPGCVQQRDTIVTPATFWHAATRAHVTALSLISSKAHQISQLKHMSKMTECTMTLKTSKKNISNKPGEGLVFRLELILRKKKTSLRLNYPAGFSWFLAFNHKLPGLHLMIKITHKKRIQETSQSLEVCG